MNANDIIFDFFRWLAMVFMAVIIGCDRIDIAFMKDSIRSHRERISKLEWEQSWINARLKDPGKPQ